MHPVDLTWAALALLGAAYPVYRLSSYRFRQSSRDFLALVCIMALYPLCLLLYPHTPFDRGLMYGVLQFLAPLYFFSIVGYLDLKLPGYVWLRRGVFALTSLVAADRSNECLAWWFRRVSTARSGATESHQGVDKSHPGHAARYAAVICAHLCDGRAGWCEAVSRPHALAPGSGGDGVASVYYVQRVYVV